MTTVDPKLMTIVQAIKQSIETSSNPGLAVNAHPNAFFVNVNGAIDLLNAAKLVSARLDAYVEGAKARFDADVQKIYAKLVEESRAGAVSIEDALARIKAKAGGELLAVEGALDTAVAKAQDLFNNARVDVATAASAVDGH